MEREMLLDKYLQGALTEEEQVEFDALLKSDSDFKQEVEFQADVKRVVTAEEDDSFMKMLSEFDSEALAEEANIAKDDKPVIKMFPAKWLVAASIALIAGLTIFFLNDKPTTPEALFAANFRPNRNITHPVTMSGDDNQTAKTRAFTAYESENYENAASRFAKLYGENPEPNYLFYRANALIALDRSQEAIPLLQKYGETQDEMANRSPWYLAMAYLQLEDIPNAKNQLESTVRNGTFKVEEAEKLLRRLEVLK